METGIQRWLLPSMLGVSVLVHAAVVFLFLVIGFEPPELIHPELGKTSILLRPSEAARPKPAEVVFEKSLADTPPMPDEVAPKDPGPKTKPELVSRPRDITKEAVPELKPTPVLNTLPDMPDLEPLTLPVAKPAPAIAIEKLIAKLDSIPARPKVSDDAVPELRPDTTIVPAPELPPLELPKPIAENVPTTPPREQSPKQNPQALDRPVAKEVVPKLEAVTKIAELVTLPSEASIATQGATVDELPRKLPINPAPPYPVEALAAGIEGTVTLRVKIDSTGRAAAISIYTSSGSKSLDESAYSTVRNWVFSPARRGGQTVQFEVLVPVEFFIRRRPG